ncbi:type I-U CRISPR-associated helicase/endonuclease Cas3 [Candidatus Palauibacter sp.]|uniref:type I-G CRISPR-associated helicase/endonuclease Cas3g n=1 Tax=Candidatus Palauibacter sp. TaxID=3101350 RepID=UPI003B0126FA
MTDGSRLAPIPKFPDFYEALNDREPFPWQTRLAEQVGDSGCWPPEIGVPTGLGKTACLDIAIWWLASQAGLPPSDRTAPTRIWWLVNRRLLVDSTADHAERIRDALREGGNDVLRTVAARLRSLAAAPTASPLEVIRLRGGVASRRPTDPSVPTVILSTIPMYGSRLLFRGYGTSRTLRPVEAALAGCDSLLLVDEAHLARHLTNLIPALAACNPGAEQVLNASRSRPRVVALTATGEASEEDRFDLDEQDRANETVRKRLNAAKPVRVVEVSKGRPEEHLADVATELVETAGFASSCLVFANTPDTARRVLARLRKQFSRNAADLLLLTGRTREREAERIRKRILHRGEGMAANRDPRAERTRHLIVVATQTLEVGADIDAEYMVTEACGVRALTQRLGRLNRLGRFDHARGVYVHAPPPKQKARKGAGTAGWPVYGREPVTVLERLKDELHPRRGDVDLSPSRVSNVLGEPHDDPGRAPEVLDGLLWEWVKTTTQPAGEAPVEPYFSGISGVDYSVAVIWRAHLPEAGMRIWPRPFEREVVSVPIRKLRDALAETSDVHRLRSDQTTVEVVAVRDVRPGDTVLLPSNEGRLDEFGWNPDAVSPVLDVSILERGLPLDQTAIERLGFSLSKKTETKSGLVRLQHLLAMALGEVRDDEEIDKAEQREAAEQFLQALLRITPGGWDESEWDATISRLDPEVVVTPREVARLRLTAPETEEERGIGSDEMDETSLSPAAVHLDPHGEAVGALSGLIAERLGLARELATVVGQAGRWHDIGKADPRFQRWLDPDAGARNGRSSPLLAKSGMPRSRWNATQATSGWPRGGRHEELSARLLQTRMENQDDEFDPGEADLLLHLVASHHGNGRPLTPPTDDGAPDRVAWEVEGVRVEAPADLSLIDWEQPARFRRLNRRFGPWGLALLEAVLRQADHAVSSGMLVPEGEATP